MSYRLYVKEPDEIKGIKVDDFDSIEDVRATVRAVMEDRPEGTFAYVYRLWGRPRPIEAYEIKDGEIVRIFTRYGGGEWPITWSPGWDYYLAEKSRHPFAPAYESPFESWKESKEEFLRMGPQKEYIPGEEYSPSYERGIPSGQKEPLRYLLGRLGVGRESEEWKQTFRDLGRKEEVE